MTAPTTRQIEFARTLAQTRRSPQTGMTVAQALAAEGTTLDEWCDALAGGTRRTVSMLINNMVAWQAVDGAAPTPRTNRYDGRCTRCGATVPAGEGVLAQTADRRWYTTHRDGACPQAATPLDLPDVPAGHYAIASTGNNDLAFYRVDRPTEGRWAGRTFVKLIIGGRPDTPVGRAAVPGILARIAAAGIAEAATLYGREIGRCYVCNRTLTDETSRAYGIGPDCASRYGIHADTRTGLDLDLGATARALAAPAALPKIDGIDDAMLAAARAEVAEDAEDTDR